MATLPRCGYVGTALCGSCQRPQLSVQPRCPRGLVTLTARAIRISDRPISKGQASDHLRVDHSSPTTPGVDRHAVSKPRLGVFFFSGASQVSMSRYIHYRVGSRYPVPKKGYDTLQLGSSTGICYTRYEVPAEVVYPAYRVESQSLPVGILCHREANLPSPQQGPVIHHPPPPSNSSASSPVNPPPLRSSSRVPPS